MPYTAATSFRISMDDLVANLMVRRCCLTVATGAGHLMPGARARASPRFVCSTYGRVGSAGQRAVLHSVHQAQQRQESLDLGRRAVPTPGDCISAGGPTPASVSAVEPSRRGVADALLGADGEPACTPRGLLPPPSL
jgi:hypothetical protein